MVDTAIVFSNTGTDDATDLTFTLEITGPTFGVKAELAYSSNVKRFLI